MFSTHTANIKIDRNDPSGLIDVKKETDKVLRLFARMAESIVVKNLLAAPKDPREVARAKAKMAKQAEFDERLKMAKSFISIWNKWREFYFDLSPYTPKQTSQLTAIESAIKFCNENEMDINMMIGCLHCAFKKRRIKPSFFNLYDEKAMEIYDNYYNAVIADLDRRDAVEASSRGTDE